MATYTAVTDAEIDQDSPITQTLMTKYRDNLTATAEGASGAPILATGWHPYNKTTVGGTETGVFYDFSVNNEAAFIETPAFEDGYEYAVRFEGLSGVGVSQTLEFQAFEENSGGYFATSATISQALNASSGLRGVIFFPFPRLLKHRQKAIWYGAGENFINGNDAAVDAVEVFGSADVVGKIKFQWSSGNIDGGKAFLLRRREYVTG